MTFNDALCNSTLEVIITNTMQVITFDPRHHFTHTLSEQKKKRERREGEEDDRAARSRPGPAFGLTAEVQWVCRVSRERTQLQKSTDN